MQRVPEPELMDNPVQVQAYAEADFGEPHDQFVALFREKFSPPTGTVLDLGCGPGDICRRFVRAFPKCALHAVDASEPMLAQGRKADQAAGLETRINYFQAYLPDGPLPLVAYSAIISNSLLHHLNSPDTLWKSLRRFAIPDTCIFVMDLLRPVSVRAARQLVTEYASGEPSILQKDFYNSLLAAYRPDEVEVQLVAQGMDRLTVEVVSDRHFIVYGNL